MTTNTKHCCDGAQVCLALLETLKRCSLHLQDDFVDLYRRHSYKQGCYAALLVSLHGTGLYERYHAATDPPETVQAVQAYLARERVFQEELLATLRADPHYAPYATEEVVARNRRLVQVWNALSLAICFGRQELQAWQQPSPMRR